MAIEKVVDIKVNTREAVTETEKLTKAIERIAEAQEEANKQSEKSAEDAKKRIEEQKKATEEARKPLNRLANGFKGLGTAIKATGIGLLIGLVAKLTTSFSGNSKVVNFFNTSMIALNKAFNDLFEFIFSNFGKWTGFIKDAFESPKETLKNLGEAIKRNLIERFESLLETLGYLGKAIKQLFEGDFKGAMESAKEAGKEFVDVATGVDGSVEKITEAVEKGAEAIKEYAKETVDASKKINELRSSFAQIENQQTRLREAADRDAEAQRRFRDDYTKTIDDRIKANNELANVLDRQEEAEKATVQARINALRTENQLLGFKQERANEIYALETELIAIEAQQAGFRAEQEANAIALQKEKQELLQSELDTQKELQLDKLEFEAEQEEIESNKIIKLQERLALENELLEEDIERKREIFLEGTQARVDAENEYLKAKQELAQKEIQLDAQASETKKKTAKAEEDFKVNLATGTLGLLASVAKEGSALAKGVAVAQATISTFQGINKALAETTDFTPTQSLRFANAAIVGASGFANIASILSTNESGQSAPSAPSQTPAISAPSFNLVTGTGTDQIADSIQNQDRPIKAYVVSSDMTSQQALDRNAVETASL